MKKSKKSNKIQAIIDEWSVKYNGVILLAGKNQKTPQTGSIVN